MKRLLLFCTTLFMSIFAFGTETNITGIKKVADGFYLMYYDTTAVNPMFSKSAIIEFKNYIALVEMPLVYSNSNIKDHTEGGEKVWAALKNYFPKKPLKYIISTHWHPHSISSIRPFISRGVTVVTTKNNFKKLSEFVDSATYEQYKKQFLFVETDSLVIKDAVNSVVLYKCNHADYGYIPTDDFLYCYLPKYQCLQTSCMYQRLGGTQIRNKEMISGRVENLYSFIKSSNLHPVSLLCTDNEYDAANGTISIDSLEDVMKKGIGMVALENELLSINETTLIEKDDSLLKAFVINPTAHSVFNKVVYSCLEKQQLRRALGYAKLQALLYPSDPNSWDTYGEVYYFLGEIKVAKRMEIQSTRIDKDFKAGEKTWQEDLEEYKKKWTGEK